MAERFTVQVVWAEPGHAVLLSVEVEPGTTLRGAVECSGLPERYPQVDMHALSLGVFGQLCRAHDMARAGDRIEVYRPLRMNPKQARRLRAQAGQSVKG